MENVVKVTVPQSGTLKAVIINQGIDLSAITNLTVAGQIDARDFETMRREMPELTTVDLSMVEILRYEELDRATWKINFNPANVIPQRAFCNCYKLISITIPHSVTHIGNNAFERCLELCSINISSSLCHIGERAFQQCSKLSSIEIPLSVVYIGFSAFYCSGLQKIVIPAATEFIGGYISASTIIVDEENKCYSSIDGVLFDKHKTTLIRYPNGKIGCHYDIPSSVMCIGDFAFYGCSQLTSITISPSVTQIGIAAFGSCTGFTAIDIPLSVKHIGQSAFENCYGLTTVNIPLITHIESYTFCSCGKLESVIIPPSVVYIGAYAFSNCERLSNIDLPSSISHIGSRAFSDCSNLVVLKIPPLSQIEDSTFSGCSELISVIIPPTITKIGNKAFSDCVKLASLVIPPSVKCIGDSAFEDCHALISLTLPPSIENIGEHAFIGCDNLTTIYNYATCPTQFYKKIVFEPKTKCTGTVYVPKNTKYAYLLSSYIHEYDSGWTDFDDICDELIPVSEIAIHAEDIFPEGTGKLTATVSPANATNKNVLWSIRNESMVDIDSAGNVFVKPEVKVIVTAMSEDGCATASREFVVSVKQVDLLG